MTWLFHARTPLHMQQLLEALVIEEGDNYLHREDMLQPIDIIECCKSLVIQDTSSGLVRFAHYTVQEYIEIHQAVLLSRQYLLMVCLTSIALPDGDSEYNPQKFRYYARRFWSEHVRGEPERSQNIQCALSQVKKARDLWTDSADSALPILARHRQATTICVVIPAPGAPQPTYVLTSEQT
jgi:hypothetical protein